MSPRKRKIINKDLSVSSSDAIELSSSSIHSVSCTDLSNIDSMDNDNSNNNINLYRKSDIGPYVVFISKENINLVKLGKAIKLNKFANVISVSLISKNLAKISFSKFADANNCILSEPFKKFDNFNAFIPSNFITSVGIVRNVPSDISLDDIKANIKSNVPISNVERLSKWNSINNVAENLDILKITFCSGSIPYNVTIYDNILLKVSYFIPNPLFCKKCLNYGHLLKKCRSKIFRCSICAKSYEENHVCDKREACKFCGLGHVSNFYKCNERYRQKQIREFMVINKASFSEARSSLFGIKQRIPKQIDFLSDNLKSNSPWSNDITEQSDKVRINILNKLVDTLKEQIKVKDSFYNEIKSLLSNNDALKDPAVIDSFKIKLANLERSKSIN